MPKTTEAQHQYLVTRRAKARAHLGGVCVRCGATEGLEFDHIDPTTKVIEIGNAIAKHWSWARLLPELAKCQLLCRPCHDEKSNEDGRAVEHGGGLSGKKNCPCPPCKARKAEYMRKYKRKTPRDRSTKDVQRTSKPTIAGSTPAGPTISM